jgi:chorismate mutase
VSDQSSDPIVEQFRNQITDTDLAILEALNKRISTVRKLHEYKAEKGYDAVDPSREEWLHGVRYRSVGITSQPTRCCARNVCRSGERSARS